MPGDAPGADEAEEGSGLCLQRGHHGGHPPTRSLCWRARTRSPSRQSMPGMEHTPWGERILDTDPTDGLFPRHTQQLLWARDACQHLCSRKSSDFQRQGAGRLQGAS